MDSFETIVCDTYDFVDDIIWAISPKMIMASHFTQYIQVVSLAVVVAITVIVRPIIIIITIIVVVVETIIVETVVRVSLPELVIQIQS